MTDLPVLPWGMKKVHEVSSRCVRWRVNQAHLVATDDLAVFEEPFRQTFVRYARESLAIEIDPRDVRVDVDEELPQTFTYKMVAYWRPADRPVEVFGGEHDGRLISLLDAPFARLHMPLRAVSMPSDLGPSVVAEADTYACVGWSPIHRRWIYAKDGSHG